MALAMAAVMAAAGGIRMTEPGYLELWRRAEENLAKLSGALHTKPPAFDLAAERKRRGLSQAKIGLMIGLRQPHVANVERGHDRLSPARIRVLRHVLGSLPVAA